MKKLHLFLFLCLIAPNLFAQEMVSSVAEEGLSKVISYDVASFTDIRDKKLQDVLVKMPGMMISTFFGTSISYNGMYVIKVFVNGIDMLDGDFSSILGMKPEDVNRIEITENYVDVKVMRGIQFSSGVSLNIILNEGARSRWSGAVKGGIGAAPLLYNGEAHALNIGSKAQTMVSLKADDTGQNYSGSVSGSPMMGYRVDQLVSITPALAPLSDERVRFNHSAIGTLNNSLNLAEDLKLNLQLTLHSDRLNASSYDETSYIMDQGSFVLNATGQEASTRTRDLVASMTLLSNTEKKYLRDNLCFTLTDNDASMDITGTFPSDQWATSRPTALQNTLDYMIPVGNNVLSINWIAAWESNPQQLTVQREGFDLLQDISSKAVASDLTAKYNVKLGRLSLALSAGTSMKGWDFLTALTPIAEINSQDNDSRYEYLSAGGTASATYITDKLQLELSLPANWYLHLYEDHLRSDFNDNIGKWYFSPSLSAKYQFGSNLSVTGMASIMDTPVASGGLYTGMVMTDFNSVSKGAILFNSGKMSSASLSFSYRLPQASFFVNGSAMRNWTQQVTTYDSQFTPNFIITGYVPDPSGRVSIQDMISLDVSKGINALKGRIGMNGSYSNYSTAITRNGLDLPLNTSTWGLGGDVNGKIFNWLNVVYSLNSSFSNIRITGEEQASTTTTLTQTLELVFAPWQQFNFSFLGDHYMNEIAPKEYKNLVLVDFKAEYRINDSWQLIGSVTNILNQETYDYKLISSFFGTSSYTSYKIRPRNFLLSLYYKF
ncbi:MAG: TonB-dependent receptor [Bacteroidales bacterium]|nr:TonB-dependent receptor [Bacteroidales bacterium]